MPKNTRQTGSQAEQKYCRKLLNDGWIVQRFPAVRFSSRTQFTGQDLFGSDIVAKKHGKTRWIQVKSSASKTPALLTETLELLKELWIHCNPSHEEVWWVGYNGKTNEWKEVLLEDIPQMLADRGK